MWHFKQEVLWPIEHFVRQSLRDTQEGQQATEHLPTWIFTLRKVNLSNKMHLFIRKYQVDMEGIVALFLTQSPLYWHWILTFSSLCDDVSCRCWQRCGGIAPDLQPWRGGCSAMRPSTGCWCVDEESREAGLEPRAQRTYSIPGPRRSGSTYVYPINHFSTTWLSTEALY